MKEYNIKFADKKILYMHLDKLDNEFIENLSKPYPCHHLELDNLEDEDWNEYKETFWVEKIKPIHRKNKYSRIDKVYISNKGRVKFIEGKEEKIIAQQEYIDEKGYRCLKLKDYSLFGPIHKMVAQSWILDDVNEEPHDDNGNVYIVHHIDNNHWNNRLDNLIYISNTQHGKIIHP